jgi:hypothetical protein
MFIKSSDEPNWSRYYNIKLLSTSHCSARFLHKFLAESSSFVSMIIFVEKIMIS